MICKPAKINNEPGEVFRQGEIVGLEAMISMRPVTDLGDFKRKSLPLERGRLGMQKG